MLAKSCKKEAILSFSTVYVDDAKPEAVFAFLILVLALLIRSSAVPPGASISTRNPRGDIVIQMLQNIGNSFARWWDTMRRRHPKVSILSVGVFFNMLT